MSEYAIDVRCPHTLGGAGPVSRCQLWAGHGGEHAIMVARNGERVVRSWRDDDPGTAHDHSQDYRSLAWYRGFPQLAGPEQ